MSLSPWLTPARRTTIAWIAVGSAMFAAAAGAAFALWPPAAPPAEPAARVAAAVALLRYPAVVVALMVASLFRILDRESALDPTRGEVSPRFNVNQRVLTNTLEQLAIFVPALCALAAVADTPATFRLVPMAVGLFSLGRVLFWGGYLVSPNARGLGFNMTFSTSVAALVAAFVLA